MKNFVLRLLIRELKVNLSLHKIYLRISCSCFLFTYKEKKPQPFAFDTKFRCIYVHKNVQRHVLRFVCHKSFQIHIDGKGTSCQKSHRIWIAKILFTRKGSNTDKGDGEPKKASEYIKKKKKKSHARKNGPKGSGFQYDLSSFDFQRAGAAGQ